MTWLSQLADSILSLPPVPALGLVFLLPALEASIFLGFVFPGETALVLGGVVASQHRVSVILVVLAAVCGAIVGDNVGYLVGRRYGERILGTRLARRIVKPARQQEAEAFLNRYGPASVFIGRFTTALRVLVPGLAGLSGVRFGTFVLFNALGAACWAPIFVIGGYLAGANYKRLLSQAGVVGLIVLAAVVVVVAGMILRRQRRPSPAGAGPDS
jgi:undecaprenyl-diphosphatase